jgi:hypothetical protein
VACLTPTPDAKHAPTTEGTRSARPRGSTSTPTSTTCPRRRDGAILFTANPMSEHVDTLVSLALTAANTRYGVAVATGADLTHAIERHGLRARPVRPTHAEQEVSFIRPCAQDSPVAQRGLTCPTGHAPTIGSAIGDSGSAYPRAQHGGPIGRVDHGTTCPVAIRSLPQRRSDRD